MNPTLDISSLTIFIDTVSVGLLGYFMRSKFAELDRVATLLNTTREESARDHATREEVTRAMERLGDRLEARLDKLNDKLDNFANQHSQ